MDYMPFFCKNPECNRIFLGEDLYKRTTPETYRYCSECEENGFPKIRFDGKNKKMLRKSTFGRLF